LALLSLGLWPVSGLVISEGISRNRTRDHWLGARERRHVRDDTFVDI
jgi:hypothetical protein